MDGTNTRQVVTIGRTESSIRGLFTNRFLALPIQEMASIEDIKSTCRACGFDLQLPDYSPAPMTPNEIWEETA